MPQLVRISVGSGPAPMLMKYYWDTIDRCVRPATILNVLWRNGFVDARRRVYCDFLSEYLAVKSGPT